jgi:hypothetical protein
MGNELIGKLTSVENGPERNVTLRITPTEVYCEISSPCGVYKPESIVGYEITDLAKSRGVFALVFVLSNSQRVQFYATQSKFDMALLIDQLDGTIGERPRKVL